MKCNASLNGFCVAGLKLDKLYYHIKSDPVITVEDMNKLVDTFKDVNFISNSTDMTITPLSNSLIRCNGQEDKEGCWCRMW